LNKWFLDLIGFCMAYCVYIIYSPKFDKYYVGQTNDFETRLFRHNNGLETFTRPFRPWTRICVIEKPSRSEAVILEKKLKNYNRNKLLEFIKKYT
jgi:putative endonuclease